MSAAQRVAPRRVSVGSARFDAFISYSHAADGRLAPAVQRALERLATPWYRRRGLHLFRDRTGLSVNPSLWSAICDAMDDARWFVLFASPESAGSAWVNREVGRWCDTHSADRLLVVVTGGEWVWDEAAGDLDWERSTAAPPALHGRFREEPLYLDLRWAKDVDTLDRRHSRFRDAMAELAAPLRGTTKDELESEDVRLHRRAVRLAVVAVTALVVLAVAAVTAGVLAVANARSAERRRVEALSRGLALESAGLRDTQLDTALLLAVAAQQVDATTEAATSLVTALHHSPGLVTILHRHVGQVVTSAAVTPDGLHLVSGGQLGLLAVGPLAADGTGDTGYLSGHAGVVWDVAVAPDGATAVSAGEDGTVRLWDLASRRPVGATFTGHEGAVFAVAYAPDGRLVASGGLDGTVRLWDLAAHAPLGGPLTGHEGRVVDLAFDPSGDVLVSASWDGSVRRWDPRAATSLGDPLLEGTAAVDAVAVAPNGRWLVAGDADGTIHRWALAVGDQAGQDRSGQDRSGQDRFGADSVAAPEVLATQGGSVDVLAFRPDSRAVAAAGSTGVVWMWDVASGATVGAPLAGHADEVHGLAYTPDGHNVVSAAFDGTLRLWDVAGVEPVGGELLGHPGAVRSVAADAVGRLLVTAGDWGVAVRDRTSNEEPTFTTATDVDPAAVTDVALAPDGRRFATAGYDGTVVVWDVEDARPVRTLTGHDGVVTAIAWSGDRLASGGADGTLRLWDPASGEAIGRPVDAHADQVADVAFSPDGHVLVSAGWDGAVRRWDVTEGGLLADGPVVTGHAGAVGSVAVSPDGRVGASGGFDGTVRLWDLVTGEPVGPALEGHTDAVLALALGADGRTLASGGADRTIRLWDVPRHTLLLGPLTGHRGTVTALAFTADGALLSSSDDHTVRTWALDPASLEVGACRMANRNLTELEWAQLVGDEPYRWLCPEQGLPLDPASLGVPLRP